MKAVSAYRRRTGKPLPPGEVRTVGIEKDPEIVVTLQLVADHGNPVIVPLAGAELAAALIGFCIESKVPVPATAQKSLTILDGHLALKITK
ncbi:hypothetical protein [Thalassospira sp.]|uniref:hypothetical protein n=1 Tax=Thalassospira sp. TaxID=1912094 RepID=UPI002736C6B5|nr:hypothetical protein [Thalassospira sp.]MDP2697455.1 hypothetical protein [Thalassospira sp.]